MRSVRIGVRLVPLVALGSLIAVGCGRHNVTTEVPVDVGFSPLEPLSPNVAYPAAAGNVLHPEGLGPVIQVPGNGHYSSHAVGYVNAPVAKVYQAMHDPASNYIHNTEPPTFASPVTPSGEDFPIAYVLHYVNDTVIGPTYFDVTTRGGVASGNELVPLEVGRRHDKTWGTPYIRVMSGSLVARPVPGDEGVTEVELEAWLDARTQDQSNCDGSLRDQYNDLVGVVAALPP